MRKLSHADIIEIQNNDKCFRLARDYHIVYDVSHQVVDCDAHVLEIFVFHPFAHLDVHD